MSLQLPPIAAPGDRLDRVGTPALLIDLDAFEHNLAQMAEFAARHKVALRPHAKAHKAPAIAHAQLARGAAGICCQKLSEAYPFAAAGIQSIHISNEFIGADKVAMAVALAGHVALSVCADDLAQIAALGAAASQAGVSIAVLPEVDVGQGRCGVDSADALSALVDAIARHRGLCFGGLQAYHGGIQHQDDWAGRRAAAGRAADATAAYVRHLEARGVRCGVVTGGGTGTVEFDAASGVYTEIQPGSYVFMDRHYGSLAWEGELRWRHSLFIAATIMSQARPGMAVCDAGLKSVAVDSGLPRLWPAERADQLRYTAANDEHGMLQVLAGDAHGLLGERLLLVPGHCDPTANLYDQYVGFRGERVECVWPIAARGLSR